MTTRRLARISLAGSLLIQATLLGIYGWSTRGCFCSITGLPSPRMLPEHHVWFLRTAQVWPPLRMPYLSDLPGVSPQVDEWLRMAVVVTLNGFIWFDLIFLFLFATVFLCRVRIGNGTDGRRIRLAERSAVRGWAVAAVPLVLLLLAMTGGAVYRGWWMAQAERALHASFEALRAGGESPRGVSAWWMNAPDTAVSWVFTGPYVLERDSDAPREHFLDRFVPPDTWIGNARFKAGARHLFFISREEGQWDISIETISVKARTR